MVKQFPAVLVTGPRQCGKTTMLRQVLGGGYAYVTLDAPADRALAIADPRTFLDRFGEPVIIDEVQNAPELLHYLKVAIDERRDVRGRFVLTGSQNLLLMDSVSETLAGRMGVLTMSPLSIRELQGEPDRPLPWERDPKVPRTESPYEKAWGPIRMWEAIQGGWFPELWRQSMEGDARAHWWSSFIQLYIERDVRSVKQVGDLGLFQTFVQVLAARHGGLLNLADVGRDVGVTAPTVRTWMSVLQAGHMVELLRPYHKNHGKRLVKSPKLYFTDSGLVCALLGITTPEAAMRGPMAGALFEGTMIMEIRKAMQRHGTTPRMWAWRTSAGEEIDLLVEAGQYDDLWALEAKSSATVQMAHVTGLDRAAEVLGIPKHKSWVVTPGPSGVRWLGLAGM
jgi:predicted AAA+ superfamily ATPase